MLVTIPVLKEALRVKSVSLEPISKGSKDSLCDLTLVTRGLRATIESLCSNVVEFCVNCLLQVLLGEYLINCIAEVSPTDMATFLGSAEVLNNGFEFNARENNLCHVKADAELCISNVT